jgi:hypothetical protein
VGGAGESQRKNDQKLTETKLYVYQQNNAASLRSEEISFKEFK